MKFEHSLFASTVLIMAACFASAACSSAPEPTAPSYRDSNYQIEPIAYMSRNGLDWLTMESRGDNIHDYMMLKSKAEGMCVVKGKKDGVDITYAYPGNNTSISRFGYYTVAYVCKE